MSKSKQRTPERPLRQRSATNWQHLCRGGLAALLVATPLLPAEANTKEGTSVVLVMAWLLLLFGWSATQFFASGKSKIRLRWPGLLLLVVAALYATSSMVLAGQGDDRANMNVTWQWVVLAIAFFLIRQLARSAQHQRAVCSVMLGLALGLSLHGLHQYFYSLPKTVAEYYQDPEAKLAEAGLHAPPGSVQRQLFESRLTSQQPFATFGLANSLAGFLVPWLILAIAIAAGNWRLAKSNQRFLVGLLSIIILGLWCLWLTRSRSGCAAVLLGLGGLVLGTLTERLRRGRVVFGMTLAGAGLLAVLFAAWLGSAESAFASAAKSLQFRLQYWASSIAMIRDHPWWGCGPGNFQEFYTRYKQVSASESIADPHNFLIEIAATAGLPAAFAFLAALVAIARIVSRPQENTETASPFASPESDPGGSVPIYLGAAGGVLFAYPAGMVMDSAPQAIVAWLCLTAGAAVVYCLHIWVTSGKLSTGWCLAAAGGQLINLLAAGGISYASVSLSTWFLLALSINRATSMQESDESLVSNSASRNWIPWTSLIGAMLLTVTCLGWSYQPTVRAHHQLALGRYEESQHRIIQATDYYRRATNLDPEWPLTWKHLAAIQWQRWIANPSPTTWQSFVEATDALLGSNPHSSAVHRLVGHWYVHAFQTAGDPYALERALAALETSCRLHPSRAIGHAELAWTYWLAGKTDLADQRAERALSLDTQMPHTEQKLANQRLFPGRQLPLRRQAPKPPPDQNAEQLMQWLRNQQSQDSVTRARFVGWIPS